MPSILLALGPWTAKMQCQLKNLSIQGLPWLPDKDIRNKYTVLHLGQYHNIWIITSKDTQEQYDQFMTWRKCTPSSNDVKRIDKIVLISVNGKLDHNSVVSATNRKVDELFES